jgi:hypothetical protein
MNNTISEGNSEVLKSGYIIAIVFVVSVSLVFIIICIKDCYKSFRDKQFITSVNVQRCKKDCSYDDLVIMEKKINNYYHKKYNIPPTISILPTNISKSSYV